MKVKSVLLTEQTIDALQTLAFEKRMALSPYIREVLESHVVEKGNKLIQADKAIKASTEQTKKDLEDWDTEVEIYDMKTGETRKV